MRAFCLTAFETRLKMQGEKARKFLFAFHNEMQAKGTRNTLRDIRP